MTDPDHVWLEPECAADNPEGRCWSEFPLEDCDEDGCGCKAIRYTRDDLANPLAAMIMRNRASERARKHEPQHEMNEPIAKAIRNNIAREIDAIPLPCSDAELLAAALKLPQIVALVDAQTDSFAVLIDDARIEAAKAMRKFPQPNYVISKFTEEAGEVVKALIHCAENRETAENVRGEMKQAIAMLYRIWVEGDQVHGLNPIAAMLSLTTTPPQTEYERKVAQMKEDFPNGI